MAGEAPGPAAQAAIGPDGRIIYVSPVTDLADYSLPPGSPGAVMLAGPRAAHFSPRKAASMAPVIAHPAQSIDTDPPPGVPIIQGMPDGSLAVVPLSYYGLTGDDAGSINAACLQALRNGQGGIVRLAPYTFSLQSQVSVPSTVSLLGSGPGTILAVNFTGVGVYFHRTAGYPGGQFGLPADQTCGRIERLVIDGTNAGGGSVGLDVGDGWGLETNIAVTNFTAAGCVGVNMINHVVFTEKCHFKLHLMNNDTACIIDANNGANDVSHEYCEFEFYLFANANQQGIVLQNGSNCSGCFMRIRGNMESFSAPQTTAALTLTGLNAVRGSSQMIGSMLHLRVEGNPGRYGGVNYPAGIRYGLSTNQIQQCGGVIHHSLGPSVLNGGEFSFRGIVSGDAGLIPVTPPYVANTPIQNLGPDVTVCIAGGTVTGITISGSATGLTSGPFFLPAGGWIQVNSTVNPTTWNWVPAGRSQY